MRTDVFISYSSEDATLANALCAHLEARRIRCWIAPRDVLPGAIWAEAIIEAIEHTRVVVLVVSESANLSRQVLQEVERAVHKGVVIIPFRVAAVTLSKGLEYFLGSRHWLDAVDPPLERHLEALAGRVQQILSGSDVPREPLPPPGRRRSAARLWAGVVATVAFLAAVAWWIWGRPDDEASGAPKTIAAPSNVDNTTPTGPTVVNHPPPVAPPPGESGDGADMLVTGALWFGTWSGTGGATEPCVVSLDRRTGDRLTLTAYFPHAEGDAPHRWLATLAGTQVRGEGQGLNRQRLSFEAGVTTPGLRGTWRDDGGRSGTLELNPMSPMSADDLVAGSTWTGNLESAEWGAAPSPITARVTSRSRERVVGRVVVQGQRNESALIGVVLGDQFFGTIHNAVLQGTQRIDANFAVTVRAKVCEGRWADGTGRNGALVLRKD